MNRRAFLAATVTAGLAGCSSGSDEPTPTPSPTAEPTDSPTPEATPAPDEASYRFNGSGGDVTDGFDTAGGLVVFDLTHDGTSNFTVHAVDESGDEELLANHIGGYDGRVAVTLPAASYVLDVDADGPWTAAVTQPRYSSAEVVALPFDASGVHADFFGPFRFEGRTEVTVRVGNEAQAAAWLANTAGERVDLLANDIGPYEQTATVRQSGFGLIVLDTDGAEWEIQVGG